MESVMLCLLLIIVTLPCIYLVKIYAKWKRKADIINKMPGPPTYPIIGTTWELMVPREDLFAVLVKRTEEYRPFFRTWLGPIPEVHIFKAQHIETILTSSTLIQKGHFYYFLHPWLGQGLLTSTGSRWHSHRKLLTPAFHFSVLENFIEIFVEKSELLVKKLKPLADGQVFDVCPEVTLCALDIICKTAMGVEINAMSKSNSEYVTAIYEICEAIMHRGRNPWLLLDTIFYRSNYGKRFQHSLSILHGFTNKVIKERQETRTKKNVNAEDILIGKKERMAFLDLLLEAKDEGADLSDTDIREEVDTFMFEGHDTTTAGICWTLYTLGSHPDIQDKVAEELKKIFHDDPDRSITMQDLSQMKYLERVIKESLRLYPSVPFILRQTNESVNIGGYDVPPDSVLVIHIRDAHRDPEYFPNPQLFDPDQFLPERCQTRHPFAYIPFSAGPRNCIGQKFALLEEKTVLSSILRKYQIKSHQKVEDLKFFPELILRSQNGIKVSLALR